MVSPHLWGVPHVCACLLAWRNRRRSAAADDLEGCCAAHGRHLSTSATDAVGRRTGNTDNRKSHLEVLREDEDQYVCGALDQQCLATRKSHVSSSCRTL